MLLISPSQIQSLEQGRVESFARRARKFLCANFPDVAEDYHPHELDRLARQAVGRGNLYGMAGESNVLQLLVLMVLLGADFDLKLPEADAVRKELSNERRSADDRLDRVFDLLSHRLGGKPQGA